MVRYLPGPEDFRMKRENSKSGCSGCGKVIPSSSKTQHISRGKELGLTSINRKGVVGCGCGKVIN